MNLCNIRIFSSSRDGLVDTTTTTTIQEDEPQNVDTTDNDTSDCNISTTRQLEQLVNDSSSNNENIMRTAVSDTTLSSSVDDDHNATATTTTTTDLDKNSSDIVIGCPASDVTEQSICSSLPSEFDTTEEEEAEIAFTALRCNYLLVTLSVMLADGLQGTHLYVLYESYGFSVASLYAIGFAFGAITTPITGPLVDKFGRKKSALLYCILEIGINMLEQYPFLSGLIVSRIVGGVTTNLLSTVFDTWLDTEYRLRGFENDKYEIIMRDSVIVSNIAAIASGYLAHLLAERFGPVGPFRGAVTCTALALVVIFFLWNENYGSQTSNNNNNDDNNEDGQDKPVVEEEKKSIFSYGQEAFNAFRNDSRVLRVGIIQGLTVGSLQIFIFLWSPTLQTFSQSIPSSSSVIGLDSAGEPAYGLIFGSFMAAGVGGGLLSPYLRRLTTALLSPLAKKAKIEDIQTVDGEEIRPMAVEFLASACYILSAMLLLVPCVMDTTNESSFTISLSAFLAYEILVGIMMPCEGVIRSLYLPSDARASMMTLPRIIVNLAVALGVIITRSITTQLAFAAISLLMAVAAILQLSLISKREWDCIFGKVDKLRESASEQSQMLRRSSSKFLSRMLSSTTNFEGCCSEEEQQLETSKSKMD